jgi:cytochrome c peroxidase
MHDGSVATLEDAIDIYARGGRLIEEGPFAGDGADNPFKSEFVSGFELTEGERTDLVAFLASLTDEEFLTDPAFANPWISE